MRGSFFASSEYIGIAGTARRTAAARAVVGEAPARIFVGRHPGRPGARTPGTEAGEDLQELPLLRGVEEGAAVDHVRHQRPFQSQVEGRGLAYPRVEPLPVRLGAGDLPAQLALDLGELEAQIETLLVEPALALQEAAPRAPLRAPGGRRAG